MKPLLTIGMATYNDYDGVFFTINSIILHHPEILDKIEFVVIDNNPDSKHGIEVESLINKIRGLSLKFNPIYIKYSDSKGTSATRNKVFEIASGDFVACVDCHVLFPVGSLKKLIDYLEENPNNSDLIHGPLITESGGVTTHMNYQWRSEMLGTWGSSWKKGGNYFSCLEINQKAIPVSLVDGRTEIKVDGFENVQWAGHDNELIRLGCQRIGISSDEEPFEIPGHGMGVFVCSKAHWPKFNQDSTHFGGEEMYVHIKHRQSGHKVILLPFLRWLHRFGRPNGVEYPITAWNKIRNYILEFIELGLDLQEVYKHFVIEEKKISNEEWDYLIHNPKEITNHPTYEHLLFKMSNVEEVFNLVKKVPTSLNENLDIIKKYADMSETCVDYSLNGQTAVGLISSDCKNIVINNGDSQNMFMKKSLELVKNKTISINDFTNPLLSNTDLLILDNTTEGEEIFALLDKLHSEGKLNKYVIINNARGYQYTSASRKSGIMIGVTNFLKKYPEFIVLEFITNQQGLVVLSRDKKDRKPLPKFTEMASNLFIAAKDFISDGATLVSNEQYESRLATCAICPHRNNTQCSLCGCFIEPKAKARSQSCPIGHWDLKESE